MHYKCTLIIRYFQENPHLIPTYFQSNEIGCNIMELQYIHYIDIITNVVAGDFGKFQFNKSRPDRQIIKRKNPENCFQDFSFYSCMWQAAAIVQTSNSA